MGTLVDFTVLTMSREDEYDFLFKGMFIHLLKGDVQTDLFDILFHVAVLTCGVVVLIGDSGVGMSSVSL